MLTTKTRSIVVMLLFGTGAICAQNSGSLTASKQLLRSGDRIVKQQVEYKDPGSSGRELTWDFRALQPINEEYKIQYFYPDSVHSTEKICGHEHGTRYYYLQHNDSIRATGFENSTTLMQYDSAELKLKFPFSYGDTLFSRFAGKGQYCHRLPLRVKGYTHTLADAEGKLLLPDETIKKALRIHSLRHYTEMGKDSVEMILDTYSWYASGIRYPVFESIRTALCRKGTQTDATGNALSDTAVFTTSFYYPPSMQLPQIPTDSIGTTDTAGGTDPAILFTEARYMPNPVVTDLNLSYRLTQTAKIWFTLHNNVGLPQYTGTPATQPEGYYSTTIPMSQLMTGTYMLYIHVDEMVMRQIILKK